MTGQRCGLGLLAIVLGACATVPGPRPLRADPSEAEKIWPGDTLALWIDPWLDGEVTVDEKGSAVLPSCGAVALGDLAREEASAAIASCLVDAQVYATPPHVHMLIRSGSSVTVFVGAERASRVVPFEPGMTVVSELVRALGVQADGLGERVILRRKGVSYVMDVGAILDGQQEDEPLERGDELLLEADIPLRPIDPSPHRLARPSQRPSSARGSACGDLLLEDAGASSTGMGPRHPHVVEVREAMAANCSDETAGASLREACLSASRARAEALQSRGPAHPEIRKLEAQLSICPPIDVPTRVAPPTAAECAALRAQRDAHAAEEKGKHHPLVMAVLERLDACD